MLVDSRGLLFDADVKLLRSGRDEFHKCTMRPARVEHVPHSAYLSHRYKRALTVKRHASPTTPIRTDIDHGRSLDRFLVKNYH